MKHNSTDGVTPAAWAALTDERIDEIAEAQTWHDGDSPRLDHRRFARDVLAAAGVEVPAPAGFILSPPPVYDEHYAATQADGDGVSGRSKPDVCAKDADGGTA